MAAVLLGAAACAGEGPSTSNRTSTNSGSPYAGIGTSVAASPVNSVLPDGKGSYVQGGSHADPDSPGRATELR